MKKNLPLYNDVKITGVAAEGKAVARVNDCVVFVPGCVPGDIVDLQVTKKKHSFMEGRVERFIRYSDTRCEPRCRHFGTCGGCKWQMLPYEEQLRYKQQQIADNLTRIGKLTLPEISPIIGSKRIYEYRNKLEFSCSDRKWVSWDEVRAAGGLENTDTSYGIGFHITGAFDKVLDIEQCHLMPDINNRIRNFVREYGKQHNLTFYNERTHSGFLRSLILRSSGSGDKLMLTVVFAEEDQSAQQSLLEELHSRFPEITALLWVLNKKFNDTINDLDVNVFSGKDHVIEEMEDLQFKVGPKSFYQTNTEQAYELYKVVRELAFKGREARDLRRMNAPCGRGEGQEARDEWQGARGEGQEARDLRRMNAPCGRGEGERTKDEGQKDEEIKGREARDLRRMNAPCGRGEGQEARDEGQKDEEIKGREAKDEWREDEGQKDEEIKGLPVVYDLYTGTGTIAQFVARQAGKVVGIEYVPEAIEDAKANAVFNSIDNTVFFAGDMKKILTPEFIREQGQPDIIITDPPRAGMDEDVIRTILAASPERIVYVSCNPATQARDLAMLCGTADGYSDTPRYRITAVQPVDMFPHTQHVENVVALEREKNN